MVLLGLLVARFLAGPQPPHPGQPLAEGEYHIRRVVDGDTIIVDPEATIRLIGVNTPETVKPEHPIEPWGPEAAQFTREFLAGGRARLTFDRERVDRFGRFLAYVWVDTQMLNEELVRNGLARFEPQYRYSEAVKRRFRQAQKEAQRGHRGVWSEDVE